MWRSGAEFFAEICSEACSLQSAKAAHGSFSPKEDLTECLYVEHIRAWGKDVYAALYESDLDVSDRCGREMVKQVRLGWRDMVRKNLCAFPSRRARRLKRHCSTSPNKETAWATLVDLTEASAAQLRDFKRPQGNCAD